MPLPALLAFLSFWTGIHGPNRGLGSTWTLKYVPQARDLSSPIPRPRIARPCLFLFPLFFQLGPPFYAANKGGERLQQPPDEPPERKRARAKTASVADRRAHHFRSRTSPLGQGSSKATRASSSPKSWVGWWLGLVWFGLELFG